MSNFVHLRAHSEKSLTDSVLRIGDLVKNAQANGSGAVALTDASGLFGSLDFQSQARAAGVKPIFGVDAMVEGPEGSEGQISRLLLLAEDQTGYKNLLALVSRGYTDNNQNGQSILRRDWLKELNAGVLCLSGDEKDGEVGKHLVAGRFEEALEAARGWSEVFPGRYFIELQRRGGKDESSFVEGAARVASLLGLPPVATHPIQFLRKEDYLAHEVRVCIKDKQIMLDATRPRVYTNEQYMKSPAEMEALFSDIPQAIANTAALAQRCNVKIETGETYLPDFATPDGSPIEDYFPRAAKEGLERRLTELYPDEATRDAKRPEYEARLAFELNTIAKMGFEGYFLIVSDFIRWGLEHDVSVGPGRGSGAGSLVAYSLNITDLDPLRFNLLFERFLNPDRVSMPDFDVDFCSEKRGLVIDYVRGKYGHAAVSQIATFGTFGAKSAIRAIGSALNMNHLALLEITKMIVVKPGEDISVDQFIQQEPRVKEMLENDPQLRRVFEFARQLDGLTASVGKHAGGVVISKGRVSDYSALYVPKDSNEPVTQFAKDDLEKVGLVKFDMLGLTTMTHLDKTAKLIRQIPGQENFNLRKLDMERKDVYEKIFNRGNTFGVFQMEKPGFMRLGMDVQIESIEHLTDVLALYRPGTLNAGVHLNYVERKHGREKIASLHPLVDEVLAPTYGVIVYQEQVMQVAQKLAGYSLGEADLLRRAMGKKKPKEMEQQTQRFLEGAAKNGVSQEQAIHIFEFVKKFAEYGFNKSHSAAYAYLAHQTAYLKHVHPQQFYCALFSTNLDDSERLAQVAHDAIKNGVTLLPPDLHISGADFTLPNEGEKVIRFGFAGLHGVGPAPADALCRLREASGPFASLEDLCVKIKAGGKPYASVNSTVLAALINSGAMDAIEPNREHALKHVKVWMDHAGKVQARAEKMGAQIVSGALSSVMPLLGSLSIAPSAKAADGESAAPFPSVVGRAVRAPKKIVKPAVALKPVPRPEISEPTAEDPLARLKNEKKALGFFISGHPFEQHKRNLNGLGWTRPLSELAEMAPQKPFLTFPVAGTVLDVKVFQTKNGKGARVQLDDGTSELTVVMFAETYAQVAPWLKVDQFVCMDISMAADRQNPEIANPQAKTVLSLADLQARLAEKMHVRLLPEQAAQAIALGLAHEGPSQLTLWHPISEHAYGQVPSKLGVACEPAALAAFTTAFGEENVRVSYKKDYAFPRAPKKVYDTPYKKPAPKTAPAAK